VANISVWRRQLSGEENSEEESENDIIGNIIIKRNENTKAKCAISMTKYRCRKPGGENAGVIWHQWRGNGGGKWLWRRRHFLACKQCNRSINEEK
jgi:hypothetical protein